VKGQGAEGLPPTTETKQEEGGSLMENARAWIGAPESTAERAAGGPPSSADTREEREEGASLLEGVTAPSGSSEAAARRVAGDSSGKSRKRVRLFAGAEEQGELVARCSLSCQARSLSASPRVPLACVAVLLPVLRGKLDAFAYVKGCVCGQLLC